MSISSDKQSPIGRRHRTVNEVGLLVYDYDQMVIKPGTLPAHCIFQPWESYAEWRGEKVPITFGDTAEKFDWGISSGKGCFLHWNDFFSSCELAEEQSEWDLILDSSADLSLTYMGQPAIEGAFQDSDSSAPFPKAIPYQELFDKDHQGRTRLFYAAAAGDLKAVEKMIYRFPGTGFYPQRMGFITTEDKNGRTAADVAEQNGQKELALFLRYQVWSMENFG